MADRQPPSDGVPQHLTAGYSAFGHRSFTPEERHRIGSNLKKILGPEYMTTRAGPGGSKLTYLEGHKAITIAHEIFGFDGWSHSIVDTTIDFCDVSRESGSVSVGVSAIIKVTLKDGTSHEDYGYGSIENARSKAAAFEKAKKEAVTDGLKRALKSFGNVLGNCVYDKTTLQRLKGIPAPPKLPPLNVAELYHGSDSTVPLGSATNQNASKAAFNNNSMPPPSVAGNNKNILDEMTDIDDSFLLVAGDLENIDPKLLAEPSQRQYQNNPGNMNHNKPVPGAQQTVPPRNPNQASGKQNIIKSNNNSNNAASMGHPKPHVQGQNAPGSNSYNGGNNNMSLPPNAVRPVSIPMQGVNSNGPMGANGVRPPPSMQNAPGNSGHIVPTNGKNNLENSLSVAKKHTAQTPSSAAPRSTPSKAKSFTTKAGLKTSSNVLAANNKIVDAEVSQPKKKHKKISTNTKKRPLGESPKHENTLSPVHPRKPRSRAPTIPSTDPFDPDEEPTSNILDELPSSPMLCKTPGTTPIDLSANLSFSLYLNRISNSPLDKMDTFLLTPTRKQQQDSFGLGKSPGLGLGLEALRTYSSLFGLGNMGGQVKQHSPAVSVRPVAVSPKGGVKSGAATERKIPRIQGRSGLYVVGRQSDVSLPLGDGISETKVLTRISSLGDKISMVAVGAYHGLVVSEDRKTVWSFGKSERGALGREIDFGDDEHLPGRVQGLGGDLVKQVGCGDVLSVFLMEDGVLYAAGLLSERTREREGKAYKVDSIGSSIEQVAVESRFLLALTVTGDVYLFGEVQSGANMKNDDKLGTCRKISISDSTTSPLRNISCRAVFAGQGTAFIVDTDGHLYSFGANGFGQLGIGKSCPSQPTPVLVYGLPAPVVQVASGKSHTVFLLDNGSVYACGNNDSSQLGQGQAAMEELPFSASPVRVLGFVDPVTNNEVKISKVTCGADYSLAIDETGALWAWGSGTGYGLATVKQKLEAAPYRCRWIGRPEGGINGCIGIMENVHGVSFAASSQVSYIQISAQK
ncbi:DNA repair protein rad52 [Chytridiales sp. JEL 0842]|nr:DNA repair protein rad52 [Chytridiales sp. JEL 0842]